VNEALRSDDEIAAIRIGPPDELNAPITLAEYDPTWPQQFEREATPIDAALGSAGTRATANNRVSSIRFANAEASRERTAPHTSNDVSSSQTCGIASTQASSSASRRDALHSIVALHAAQRLVEREFKSTLPNVRPVQL
jgi:hypothetical protein